MPRELWKVSLLSGGINTAIASSDTKDTSFTNSLNCELTREGNLGSGVAFSHKGNFVPMYYHVNDDDSGATSEVRLLPEAGCFTFRHDISLISGYPALDWASGVENMVNFASWSDIFTASDLAMDDVLSTNADDMNYGYNYILIPYIILSKESVDSTLGNLSCGLVLGQSSLTIGGETFSEFNHAELNYLEEGTDETSKHPLNFWRWKFGQFPMGSWVYNIIMASGNGTGENWVPWDDYFLDDVLKTMPRNQRPSFEYSYINGKLRVFCTNTELGWTPKTLDIIGRQYPVNMDDTSADPGVPSNMVSGGVFTAIDHQAQSVIWRDAYLRVPQVHGFSSVGADSFNITDLQPIAAAHHIDVYFGQAGGDNAFHKDIDVGYSFFSHDGQETPVIQGDEYMTSSFAGIPYFQVRTIRYNIDPTIAVYDEKFRWEPWISGFRLWFRFKNLTGWYFAFEMNFDVGKYHSFDGRTGNLKGEDQENFLSGQTGTLASPFCLQSSGIHLKSYPTIPYSTMNGRKSGDISFPLYSCQTIVGKKAYIGNIVDRHGKHHGDRMLKSHVGMYDTFPPKLLLEARVNDGDEIIALMSLGRLLFQFKRYRIYIMEISGGRETLVKTLENNGITHRRSVIKGEGVLVWANEDGLFIFNGKTLTNLIDGNLDVATWREHYGYVTSGSANLEEANTIGVKNDGYIELGYDSYNQKLICQYQRNEWESKLASYALGADINVLEDEEYVALGNTEVAFVFDLVTKTFNKTQVYDILNNEFYLPTEFNTSGFSNFLSTNTSTTFGHSDIKSFLNIESTEYSSLEDMELNSEWVSFQEIPLLYKLRNYKNESDQIGLLIPTLNYTAYQDGRRNRWFFVTKDLVFKDPGRTKKVYSLYFTYKSLSASNDIIVKISQNSEATLVNITDIDADAVIDDFNQTAEQWNLARIDLKSLNSRTAGGSKGVKTLKFKFEVSSDASRFIMKDMSIVYRTKLE